MFAAWQSSIRHHQVSLPVRAGYLLFSFGRASCAELAEPAGILLRDGVVPKPAYPHRADPARLPGATPVSDTEHTEHTQHTQRHSPIRTNCGGSFAGQKLNRSIPIHAESYDCEWALATFRTLEPVTYCGHGASGFQTKYNGLWSRSPQHVS